MQAKNYDYIFLGAGCASLSIIMRMIDSKKFIKKKYSSLTGNLKQKMTEPGVFGKRNRFF